MSILMPGAYKQKEIDGKFLFWNKDLGKQFVWDPKDESGYSGREFELVMEDTGELIKIKGPWSSRPDVVREYADPNFIGEREPGFKAAVELVDRDSSLIFDGTDIAVEHLPFFQIRLNECPDKVEVYDSELRNKLFEVDISNVGQPQKSLKVIDPDFMRQEIGDVGEFATSMKKAGLSYKVAQTILGMRLAQVPEGIYAYDIKSILKDIIDEIKDRTDLEGMKEEVINYVEQRKIKPIDKDRIIFNVEKAKSPLGLIKYLYNSLLKYKGLGGAKATEIKPGIVFQHNENGILTRLSVEEVNKDKISYRVRQEEEGIVSVDVLANDSLDKFKGILKEGFEQAYYRPYGKYASIIDSCAVVASDAFDSEIQSYVKDKFISLNSGELIYLKDGGILAVKKDGGISSEEFDNLRQKFYSAGLNVEYKKSYNCVTSEEEVSLYLKHPNLSASSFRRGLISVYIPNSEPYKSWWENQIRGELSGEEVDSRINIPSNDFVKLGKMILEAEKVLGSHVNFKYADVLDKKIEENIKSWIKVSKEIDALSKQVKLLEIDEKKLHKELLPIVQQMKNGMVQIDDVIIKFHTRMGHSRPYKALFEELMTKVNGQTKKVISDLQSKMFKDVPHEKLKIISEFEDIKQDLSLWEKIIENLVNLSKVESDEIVGEVISALTDEPGDWRRTVEVRNFNTDYKNHYNLIPVGASFGINLIDLSKDNDPCLYAENYDGKLYVETFRPEFRSMTGTYSTVENFVIATRAIVDEILPLELNLVQTDPLE